MTNEKAELTTMNKTSKGEEIRVLQFKSRNAINSYSDFHIGFAN